MQKEINLFVNYAT